MSVRFFLLLLLVALVRCSDEDQKLTEKDTEENNLKILPGISQLCKDKMKNSKVIFPWPSECKDSDSKPTPLFNSLRGTLPIPTVPPPGPYNIPTNLQPLKPVLKDADVDMPK